MPVLPQIVLPSTSRIGRWPRGVPERGWRKFINTGERPVGRYTLLIPALLTHKASTPSMSHLGFAHPRTSRQPARTRSGLAQHARVVESRSTCRWTFSPWLVTTPASVRRSRVLRRGWKDVLNAMHVHRPPLWWPFDWPIIYLIT